MKRWEVIVEELMDSGSGYGLAVPAGVFVSCGGDSGFRVVDEDIEFSLSDCEPASSASVETAKFRDLIF